MDTLKKTRKTTGLSTSEVAEKMHVSKRTIENYESGKTNPDLDTLKKFSKLYGVTIDYLLDNEDGEFVFVKKEEYEQLVLLKEVISKIEIRQKIKK